jgi:RNA polymerase sigma-70 factor, ECF subfamily
VADDVGELAEPQARALLDQYIAAFQGADAAALQRPLCHDARLEAPPARTWLDRCETCVPFMRVRILGTPGAWRMLPTSANGQPAAAGYRRAPDGTYRGYGIVVLTVTSAGISHIVSFGDPALLSKFGFPTVLPT